MSTSSNGRLGAGGRGLLLLLAALSGAAFLGIEVVLGRMLHRLLGSTSLSVASVAAGFLGGMGAGALIAQRILPSSSRWRASPLVAYGATELASLCATLLFVSAAPALVALLRLPGGDAAVFFLVCLVAVPSGASFPFLVAALERGELPGRRVRVVYGWNALGGAVGALLAGLVCLPRRGEWETILVCAALQAIVAVAAILLARTGARPIESVEVELRPEPSPRSSAAGPLVLAFLFVSGFLVLYWEVLWTRILVLTVGSSVYSFSIIAGSVVLGIGAGSLLLGGKFLREHGGWMLTGLAAAVTLLELLAVPYLPDAYLAGIRWLGASPIVWGSLGAGALVFLPSFLLGSLFPWALSRDPGRLGLGYAINSAGAALGAYSAGPIGARALELEAAYRWGAAGLLGMSLLGACLSPVPRRWRLGLLAVPIGIAGALLALTSPERFAWDSKRLLSGVYQWSQEDLLNLPLKQSLDSRELLCVVPGKEVIVSVELEREANTVYVRGNGKAEGSVPAVNGEPSLADLPTQVLLGALPAGLFAAEPHRSALLIGLGSGVTLGALLDGEAGFAPRNVDVVELERAFLDAIRENGARSYISPWVPGSVLGDGGGEAPQFFFGDARRMLAVELHGRRWDAIVSQPSEPWIPGSAPLFTLELFEEAAAHLNEGGVFFQWLQIYKLDWEGIRLLARTFRRVFPYVFLVRPPATGEVILLGSMKPIAIERLLAAPAGAMAYAARLEVPADRLAVFLLGPKGIDGLVDTSLRLPVNTDSRGELEYLGARSLHSGIETARENLSKLQALGGGDPISSYLSAPLRQDRAFLRLLSSRNIRLGDFAEARALLGGDSSPEAAALREQIDRESKTEP